MVLSRTFSIGLLLLFSLILVANCGSGKKDNSAPSGKEVYERKCETCHGPEGKKGVAGAKDLSLSNLSLERRKRIIRKGKGSMIPFENVLSSAEVDSVAHYIATFRENK